MNKKSRSRKRSYKSVKKDGSRIRTQRRSNQLRRLFSQRDSQHNSNVDLASILDSIIQDTAHTDVHNRMQHRINPEIRAAAADRSIRQELRTLPGIRRRVRHLADVRSNARAKNIRRRSRRSK